jgi:hypothetical protein
MNPYLEQPDVWHDFHESLIPMVRSLLSPQLVPRYFVKIEEHVYIHERADPERRQLIGHSDVSIGSQRLQSATAGSTVLEAPARVLLPPTVEFEREAYLEIRDREHRNLVCVLELLSPTNKNPGSDREQYLAKRLHYLAAAVHFVEIDLLRGGPRMPMEDCPSCDYSVLVSVAAERPRAAFWPLRLTDRLPTIPIPVGADDRPAQLDLQEALHRVYDQAGYHYYIYSGNPEPALTAEQQEWARGLMPQSPPGETIP